MELEGNTVQIMGRVVKAPAFSHRLYGECFFCISVQVPRLSDCMDTLPVTLSERLLPAALKEGSVVEILGQVRSYNKWVNGANRLIITVFARQLRLVERMQGTRISHHAVSPRDYRPFACYQPAV